MRAREFLREYTDVASAKKEIVQSIAQLDPGAQNPEAAKQAEELIDRIYTILNKNKVLDRFSSVLPDVLQGEYSEGEILKIAKEISEAPISFKEKVKFTDNLANDKVIDPKVLITPGLYTVDQLTMNDPVNKEVFKHLKGYGVGQKMKGPAEHALAILSKRISIEGKGDVTVGDIPVEVKAAVSEKKGGGSGRFGESGRVPSRDFMVKLLNSFPKIAGPVNQFLEKQSSMNVETFTSIVNSIEDITPAERKEIGEKVFGAIFGAEAAPVIDAFAKDKANPNDVRRAYIKSNFNWYKNSDMGGEWQVLASISFADNAVGVLKDANDLDKVTVYKKNPAIITTDKPQEMLFQFNPKH
jgi:hypothetical protein